MRRKMVGGACLHNRCCSLPAPSPPPALPPLLRRPSAQCGTDDIALAYEHMLAFFKQVGRAGRQAPVTKPAPGWWLLPCAAQPTDSTSQVALLRLGRWEFAAHGRRRVKPRHDLPRSNTAGRPALATCRGCAWAACAARPPAAACGQCLFLVVLAPGWLAGCCADVPARHVPGRRQPPARQHPGDDSRHALRACALASSPWPARCCHLGGAVPGRGGGRQPSSQAVLAAAASRGNGRKECARGWAHSGTCVEGGL